MTEQELKEIRDFEKIRLKYYLIGQFVGMLVTSAIGCAIDFDPHSGGAFVMTIIFCITCCHNTGVGMDYLSRKIFKNEWSGELTDEETLSVLNEFTLLYFVLFVFFAICHIAMFIYCVYFS